MTDGWLKLIYGTKNRY